MAIIDSTSWRPVRKDFVDPATTRCHARSARGGRHHGFPTGHAYILRDGHGHEYPFGADCARALLGDASALDRIPDYTVRDAAGAAAPAANAGTREAVAAPARARRPSADAREIERRNAATRYVVLRMEKVAAVPRVQPTVRFAPLEGVYQQIVRGEPLTPAQVSRVLAIERSATTPPRLKSENLLDVYTAHIHLERLIAASGSVENIRFLRSLHDWLARHLVLSRAQLDAAGIAMHPHAFHTAAAGAAGAGVRETF